MNEFMKKWNNKSVEDIGSVMSKEANDFVKDFAKMLERQLGGEGVQVDIHPNHYDCSGFLEKDGKYVYISYEIPRYGLTIDFSASGAMNGVLYRAADSARDFRGHRNNFSSLQDLPKNILAVFDDYDRYKMG